MRKATATMTTTFTDQQMLTFKTMRARYREDADRFTNSERAQLAFLRWLYEEGRMDSPRPRRRAGKKRTTVTKTAGEPIATDGGQR